MLVCSVASTDQRTAGLGNNAGNLGPCVEIGVFGFLVAAFFFLTTCVLVALLMLERWKRRLAARVETREAGSQSPTTYTRNTSQPRLKPLPEYAHG